MTEAEWMASTDPLPMLEFVRGKASDWKLRLFACACCRRLSIYFKKEATSQLVEVSEQYADGMTTAEVLDDAFVAAAARRLVVDHSPRQVIDSALAVAFNEHLAASIAVST